MRSRSRACSCWPVVRSRSYAASATRHDAGNAPPSNLTLFVYALVLGALCIWHKQPWPYFFVLLVPTAYLLHVAWLDAAFVWLEARPVISTLAATPQLLVTVAFGSRSAFVRAEHAPGQRATQI